MTNLIRKIEKWSGRHSLKLFIPMYVLWWVVGILLIVDYAAIRSIKTENAFFSMNQPFMFIFNLIGFSAFLVMLCFLSIIVNGYFDFIKVNKESNTD